MQYGQHLLGFIIHGAAPLRAGSSDEPATQLLCEASDLSELATRKPELGKSHRLDTSAFARGGKSGACDAARTATARLQQRGESVGGHRARSAATPSRQRTHGCQEMTSHLKVSQRRSKRFSQEPRGRGLRFRRKKLIVSQTFRNSLARRFHQFLSERVGSCTLFPRITRCSSLGMLQVRWQTNAGEVELPPPHRRRFCLSGLKEPRVRPLLQDTRDADQLLVEDAPGEDLSWLTATLTKEHAGAAHHQRVGGLQREPLRPATLDSGGCTDRGDHPGPATGVALVERRGNSTARGLSASHRALQ